MPAIGNYRGIVPAIACPFTPDHRIDEPALRKLASWLAGHAGVVAVMTNGHTGEVFSLTPRERAEVTAIVAKAVAGKTPVVSSIVCEGIRDAVEQVGWARDAGANALDIMPPHHWLRFGFRQSHVMEYFEAIGKAAKPVRKIVTNRQQGLSRSRGAGAVPDDFSRTWPPGEHAMPRVRRAAPERFPSTARCR